MLKVATLAKPQLLQKIKNLQQSLLTKNMLINKLELKLLTVSTAYGKENSKKALKHLKDSRKWDGFLL